MLSCCQSCSYCSFTWASAKERSKPQSLFEQNKSCQRCMLCRSMPFCPLCSQCPQCCRRTVCRGKASTVLAYLAGNGCKSSGGFCSEERLLPSLQTETMVDKVPLSSEWLRQPRQKSVPNRGLEKPHRKVGSRKSGCQVVPCLLQPTILSPQAERDLETNPRPKPAKSVFAEQYLQDGNSGNNPVILAETGMGYLAGLQRRVFPHPNKPTVKKYLRFFLNSQTFQFTALPFGLATAPLEFTKVTKEVKLMAQAKGIRIHQYLDDWLLRAHSRETCLQHTQTLLALCQKLGWVVNMKKSVLVPQRVFNFVGYRFDLIKGRVLPTQDRWVALQEKLKSIMSKDSCTVRQFMSLVGLLTATEKQVWLGSLHMRPIQWHLKRHWHVPEVLEKVIPVPLSLHHHLGWWLNEQNVLEGQPLHPLQHALQLFTDASNEGLGAHIGDYTARGVWSTPESRLHINFLELKAVLLALKRFEPLCKGQIVLVATDNTTVVSYINKQGGMRSGSLCALLWRLLS